MQCGGEKYVLGREFGLEKFVILAREKIYGVVCAFCHIRSFVYNHSIACKKVVFDLQIDCEQGGTCELWPPAGLAAASYLSAL